MDSKGFRDPGNRSVRAVAFGQRGRRIAQTRGTDVLQRWPVSRLVKGSRASDNDATLTDELRLWSVSDMCSECLV